MLRDFRAADFFTLGNGLAGSSAILAFMRFCAGEEARFFWIGAALLPVALVMDIFDAEWRGCAMRRHRWVRSWTRWPMSCRSASDQRRWPSLSDCVARVTRCVWPTSSLAASAASRATT